MNFFVVKVRRLRPALGTFVSLEIEGETPAQAEDAIRLGFEAIAEVERLMSVHDKESELSRLNRAPLGKFVGVHPLTYRVLDFCRDLTLFSQGYFNVAAQSENQIHDVSFETENLRVRRCREFSLDLGGVAKGFAVDHAVDAIQKSHPEVRGLVNAGGDLRVFGVYPEAETPQVVIRREREAELTPQHYSLSLPYGALATSSVAPHFRRAHFNPHNGTALSTTQTVTVLAPTAMVADALTKVALAAPSTLAQKVARKYDAQMVNF